ncbi:MAG: M43 family zinc metalloprotease [Bacteroidota bacterium]
MRQLFSILLISLLQVPLLSAQDYGCGTDAFRAERLRRHPARAGEGMEIDRQMKALTEADRFRTAEDTVELTIPVAFHVIHDNGPENVPDSLVLDQIDHLNDGFANRGFYNPATGLPIHISFCLSQKGKYGEPSTGIERLRLPEYVVIDDFQDALDLMQRYSWPTEKVLNIYSVGNIEFATAFATFPDLEEGAFDQGIFTDAAFLGHSERRSAVMIHEVGHFLGLYHTFQDNCRNFDCLLQGDRVCDTPPDAVWRVYEGCTIPNNNCISDADDPSPNNPFTEDIPDQHSNYMDYNSFLCQNEFTPGQRRRMRFASLVLRPKLLGSDYCRPGLTHDATIHEIQHPNGLFCGDSVRPRLRIRNQGQVPLTTLEFDYGFLGQEEARYLWRGEVGPEGSYAWVDLPAIPAPPAGRSRFQARVSRPNNVTDQLPNNDTLRSDAWHPFAGFVPYREDFETGMPDDLVFLTAPTARWDLPSTVSCDFPDGGNTALTLVNEFYRSPAYNGFVTPVLDLARHEDPVLTFDHSFGRQDELFRLTYLNVSVGVYCDSTPMQQIFSRSQQSMLEAIIPTDSFIWTPTTCEEWGRTFIDLSPWAGQKIFIKFETNIGRKDHDRIYLDNIQVTSSYVDEKAASGILAEDIHVYPVPNSGAFTVDAPLFARATVALKLWDLRGRTLWEQTETAGPGIYRPSLAFNGLAEGLYYLQIMIGDQRFVKKIRVRY